MLETTNLSTSTNNITIKHSWYETTLMEGCDK